MISGHSSCVFTINCVFVSVHQLRSNSEALRNLLQQVAVRSIAALQEYSITGDVQAVLRVYRHLVGAQDDNGDRYRKNKNTKMNPSLLNLLCCIQYTVCITDSVCEQFNSVYGIIC